MNGLGKLKSFLTMRHLVPILALICVLEAGIGVWWLNHARSQDRLAQQARDKKIIAITHIDNPFGTVYKYVGEEALLKKYKESWAKRKLELKKVYDVMRKRYDDFLKDLELRCLVPPTHGLENEKIKLDHFHIPR